MTISLTRSGASFGGSSQWLGVEVDDDGYATSWQTSGSRVGRFARSLLPKERAALNRAMTSAQNAVAHRGQHAEADRVWRPEGSTEHLSADGLPTLELDPHDDPPQGFGSLLRFLRGLMSDLVDSPVAAIALEIGGNPLCAFLHHVGTEDVEVRLGSLSVQAHLSGADSAIVESTTVSVVGPTHAVGVGKGWSFSLGDNLGISAPTEGQSLIVGVELEMDAMGDGALRRAQLSGTRNDTSV